MSDKDILSSYGLLLKEIREEIGLTQTELAKKLGVSRGSIANYESGGAITKKYFHTIENFILTHRGVITKFSKIYSGHYIMEVPFVPIDSYSDFAQNPLTKLSTINFVSKREDQGFYVAFEIANSAMDNGTIHSLKKYDIALAKQVSKEDICKECLEDTIWFIIFEDTIFCRIVKEYDKTENKIVCQSLKSSVEFPEFPLKVDDIKKLYKAIKRTTDIL